MKKSNKKGFTIVELVIVIAVIAILAAVMIPTFSSLVKKANLSNDKSFVRNVNVTLAAEGAIEKFTTPGDAIDALNRNGFSGKYNTYSSGYHYCYSLEKNKMYLLDDSNEVIYPEENVDKATLWGLYMDSRTSATAGVTKYIAMTNITNSDHYGDVFANGTYTIDLNGYVLEADLIAIFGDSHVVDNGATKGMIKVEKGMLMMSAVKYPMLPVWNGDGYVFVLPHKQIRVPVEGEDSFIIEFRPTLDEGKGFGNSILADGAADNQLTFKIAINCYDENGNLVQKGAEVSISDELISEVYSTDATIRLRVTGATDKYAYYEVVSVIVGLHDIAYSEVIYKFTPAANEAA